MDKALYYERKEYGKEANLHGQDEKEPFKWTGLPYLQGTDIHGSGGRISSSHQLNDKISSQIGQNV